MKEGKIYDIKGQDYYQNGLLKHTKVYLVKINGYGKQHHSVHYLDKAGIVTLKHCPLNEERIIFK